MKFNFESVAFSALIAGAALMGKRKREAPIAVHSEPIAEGAHVASIVHTGPTETDRVRQFNVTQLFDEFGLPKIGRNDIPLG